jgi:hypothetical protein
MPCDTRRTSSQTIQQRAEEVRQAVKALDAALVNGRASVKVGPQGAITFVGLTDEQRDGITDACAYRRLLVSGSALAKAAIARAEALAGRSVDRRAIAQGVHSHDGGHTWHHKH